MGNVYEYPVLYNEEKGRMWKIWVEDDTIFRTDGLTRKGKFEKTPTPKVIVGKRNTTPHEQALIESKRDWIKKLDLGFKPSEDDEEGMKMYHDIKSIKSKQGGNNHGTSKKSEIKNTKIYVDVDIEYSPMLAHDYQKKKHIILWDKDERKVVFDKLKKIEMKKTKDYEKVVHQRLQKEYFDASEGAFVQPKFDGSRCVAFLHNGEVVLQSRGKKQYPFFEGLRKELKTFFSINPKIVLDGELYTHGIDTPSGRLNPGNALFTNVIQSACKTVLKKPSDYEDHIRYYIFDIIDCTLSQSERFKILKNVFSKYKGERIQLTEVIGITSELELLDLHEKFVQEGYEGAMLRCSSGIYKHDRSIHLLKYKDFNDSEFTVVGAKCAKGVKKGAVIWICQVPDSEETFKCDMNVPIEIARQMYQDYPSHIGRQLNIRYFGVGENGVPRFPKGIYFRDE